MENRLRNGANNQAEAFASTFTQCAHDDTSLEVDHMILDYLAWRALNNFFQGPKAEDMVSLDEAAVSVEEFLQLFQNRHPGYKLDVEIQLRILLLKLTVLITQRLVRSRRTPKLETLRKLRANNRGRAIGWIRSPKSRPTYGCNTKPYEDCLPLPRTYLEQSRANALAYFELPAEDEAYEDSFYGTSDSVALLDLLPLFIQTSAAHCHSNRSKMANQLMVFAKELMLTACLEQFLIFGSHGAIVIDEAFAWGYTPTDNDENSLDTDDSYINDFFMGEDDGHEILGWTEARKSMMALLFDHDAHKRVGEDQAKVLLRHLERLHQRFPSRKMDRQLRDFVRRLSSCGDEPILAQLERGQLKDMSEAETQRFLLECGSDVAKMFRRD